MSEDCVFPTCMSSTGAVVRGWLLFGHNVLSGVVQVGDNCREVAVPTVKNTHRRGQRTEKAAANSTEPYKPNCLAIKKKKRETCWFVQIWAVLTTEILPKEEYCIKHTSFTQAQQLQVAVLSAASSSEVCDAPWQTTVSSTFRSHPCSSYALRCINEHIYNS